MNVEIDKAFDFYLIISYFVYIAVLLGIFTTVPSYLTILNSFVKLIISCVLMYKFNPLQKNYTLSRFDKKIVFSSGVYLLLTTFIGEYLVQYEDLIKSILHQYIGL